MKPLIENKGFNWKGFEIPAFTLNEGEMIRFWIQIIPTNDNNISGYELAKELNSYQLLLYMNWKIVLIIER